MSSDGALIPKVFLSYSWSSPEYAERVVDLANRLRVDGIDVVLDRAHLVEGHDTDVFMERSVNDPTVSHVLLLCDPLYADKADGRAGGVGKETTIVSPEVYASATQVKFIPVIMGRRDDGSVPLPAYLRSRLYFDLSEPATEELHYQRLKRRLHGKPDLELAPLGPRPKDLEEPDDRRATAHAPKAFVAAMVGHRPQRWALLEDYFEKLTEAVALERIGPGLSNAEELRQRHLESVASFLPYRDEFVAVVRTIARYGDEPEAYEQIHRLFENLASIAWDDRDQHYSDEFDKANLAFIVRELFLYAVAVFLAADRMAAVRRLLSRYFIASAQHGAGQVSTVAALDPPAGCIEENQGWRGSRTGRLLKERATIPRIDVSALRDAEVLCVVRARLDAPDADSFFLGSSLWWPRLGQGFSGYAAEQARIVARLKDPYYRDRLARVFDSESADDLRARFLSLPDLPRDFPDLMWTNKEPLLRLFGWSSDSSPR